MTDDPERDRRVFEEVTKPTPVEHRFVRRLTREEFEAADLSDPEAQWLGPVTPYPYARCLEFPHACKGMPVIPPFDGSLPDLPQMELGRIRLTAKVIPLPDGELGYIWAGRCLRCGKPFYA
jgi:hypothetical protein